MSRPHADHVATTIKALDALLRKTNGGMAARITAQLNRDRRGGSAIPDGYPSSTLGGGGGSGPTITVDDEHGEPDKVPVTATEAAVIARLDLTDDEHHRLTWAAWHKLEAILVDAQLIHGWLARLEAAGTPAAAANDGSWCENHLRHDKGCVPVLRRQLCSWCYGIQTDYGVLPTAALLDRHDRGERLSQAAIEAALGVKRAKVSA